MKSIYFLFSFCQISINQLVFCITLIFSPPIGPFIFVGSSWSPLDASLDIGLEDWVLFNYWMKKHQIISPSQESILHILFLVCVLVEGLSKRDRRTIALETGFVCFWYNNVSILMIINNSRSSEWSFDHSYGFSLI